MAMNWYDTNGNGTSYPAGNRTGDGDAMNGNAVMFDAVQGLILTVGGAPSYQARSKCANAQLTAVLHQPGRKTKGNWVSHGMA